MKKSLSGDGKRYMRRGMRNMGPRYSDRYPISLLHTFPCNLPVTSLTVHGRVCNKLIGYRSEYRGPQYAMRYGGGSSNIAHDIHSFSLTNRIMWLLYTTSAEISTSAAGALQKLHFTAKKSTTTTTHVVPKLSNCCSDVSRMSSKRHHDQQNPARQRVPRALASVPNRIILA